MIKFDAEANTFSITVRGGTEEYIEMMHALTRLLANTDETDKETIQYVSILLEEMLPTPEQITVNAKIAS